MAIVEATCRLRNSDDRPREHFGRVAHRLGERTSEVQRKISVAVIGQSKRQAVSLFDQCNPFRDSVNLRGIARKFHRGVEAAVKLRCYFILLFVQR